MNRAVAYLRHKREDILLFAASLCIAVLLFMQLQPGMAQGKEREIEVTLAFSGLSDQLTVVQAPRTVKVIAKGSQEALDRLDTSRVHAAVKLTDATPGAGRYQIEILGPKRSELEFAPIRALVEIGIERSLTAEFEVSLSAVGTPPAGFSYEGATVIPNRVLAQGPASSIESVKSVRAVLDVSDIAPGRPKSLEIEALDSNGRPVPLVNFEPRSVTVSPALTIGPSRRSLLVTPVFINQPPFGFRIESYSVVPNQVEVTGESQDVSKFTTIDTEPVDLSSLTSSRTVSVRLRLPEGVRVLGAESVNVLLVVRRS